MILVTATGIQKPNLKQSHIIACNDEQKFDLELLQQYLVVDHPFLNHQDSINCLYPTPTSIMLWYLPYIYRVAIDPKSLYITCIKSLYPQNTSVEFFKFFFSLIYIISISIGIVSSKSLGGNLSKRFKSHSYQVFCLKF